MKNLKLLGFILMLIFCVVLIGPVQGKSLYPKLVSFNVESQPDDLISPPKPASGAKITISSFESSEVIYSDTDGLARFDADPDIKYVYKVEYSGSGCEQASSGIFTINNHATIYILLDACSLQKGPSENNYYVYTTIPIQTTTINTPIPITPITPESDLWNYFVFVLIALAIVGGGAVLLGAVINFILSNRGG